MSTSNTNNTIDFTTAALNIPIDNNDRNNINRYDNDNEDDEIEVKVKVDDDVADIDDGIFEGLADADKVEEKKLPLFSEQQRQQNQERLNSTINKNSHNKNSNSKNGDDNKDNDDDDDDGNMKKNMNMNIEKKNVSYNNHNAYENNGAIPAAFVYTKELYNTTQNMFRNNTNSSTIVMNPEVYGQLTNQICRIKQAKKPLLIMINSHPCSGKSFFINKKNTAQQFMGCNLLDHDKLNLKKMPGASRDASYLMQLHQENIIQEKVTTNTALLGDSVLSAKHKTYDDVIYIYVIPALTIIKRNVKRRQTNFNRKYKWAMLNQVTKRRQIALLYAIKDEVLVEPLFATFQEGLEFCINTYNMNLL